MNLKVTPQASDANNANDHFDALRQRNYEASFEDVKKFIVVNKNKLHHRRHKRPLRNWQWVLAVLFPVVVVLACTKTEHTEPVGETITFNVQEGNDAARQALEPIVGGLQTIVVPDKHKPGYLSYTSFIPAGDKQSVDAIVNRLKGIKGVDGLSAMPVNAQVKQSLLSQLGTKIFKTHVDATGLGDEELQNAVNQQLQEKGFNGISVAVVRNVRGVRTLELHPAKDASNYAVDMSLDDGGTRMVLQEERRTNAGHAGTTEKPQPDFGSMTDAQVRDHIRRQYGSQLSDENIKITRTADEIAIEVKLSAEKEEIMRFRLR